MTPLRAWLNLLQLRNLQVATLMGVSEAVITIGVNRPRQRTSRMRYHSWMSRLADKLEMPAEVLIELHPYDPHVVPHLRQRAIEIATQLRDQANVMAAEWRLAREIAA